LAALDIQVLLQQFLDNYANIFEQPTSLPPSRLFDHKIHLLRTAPVAVQP
jgi:hypothetical protein